MANNSYGQYNRSDNASRAKRRSVIMLSLVMIMVSLAGLVLSTTLMLSPKKGAGVVSPETRVGWDDAWSDHESFTENFAGGDGSASNPYQISNPAQMARFAYVVNHEGGRYGSASYQVTANLNMSARRWDPVGRNEHDRDFYGTFDGGGFVISGISAQNKSGLDTENRNNGRLVGMFGQLYKGAVIKNMILNNASMEVIQSDSTPWGDELSNGGGVSVGVVAAYSTWDADVTFENITVNSARISFPEKPLSGFDAGAILGVQGHSFYDDDGEQWASSGTWGTTGTVTINNVTAKNVAVFVNAPTGKRRSSDEPNTIGNNSIGGLVGGARNLNITDSNFTGGDLITVGTKSTLDVGGIVGTLHTGTSSRQNKSVFENVRATGRLDIKNTSTTSIGGIVGQLGNNYTELQMTNATSEIDIVANIVNNDNEGQLAAGGIIGLNNNTTNAVSITGVDYEGNIKLETSATDSKRALLAGGLIGVASFNDTTILESKSNANIELIGGAARRLGGLIGFANKGGNNLTIQDTTAIGNLVANRGSNFGGAIGGEGTAAMSLESVKTSMNGASDYLFAGDQKGGAVISEDSWQEELKAPTITQQPEQELTVERGNIAELTIEALSGAREAEFGYQWFSNTEPSTEGGLPLLGETRDKIKLSTSRDSVYYIYAKVSNTLIGTESHVFSTISTITVVLPDVPRPQIFEQPKSQEVNLGDSEVTLSVNAYVDGKPGLNGQLEFQWYQSVGGNDDGQLIEGAKDSIYTVSTDKPGPYFYYARVYNVLFDGRNDYDISDVARVYVKSAYTPIITAHPQEILKTTVNSENSLIVGAMTEDGNGALTYQWYKSNSREGAGSKVVGATNAVYQFSEDSIGVSYYWVVVTNTVKSSTDGEVIAIEEATSNRSQVIVEQVQSFAPVINEHPEDVTSYVGDTAIVSVRVSLPNSTLYQWYRADSKDQAGVALEGATSSDYEFVLEEVGTFYLYVIVTNGSDTSATTKSNYAQITVQQPATPSGTGFFGRNWGWMALIVASLGLMTGAVLMVTKKTVEIY